MNKLVAGAFKTIAYAIIFVVVWSVGFYLFRAYALNKKMESIMSFMEMEVSKHNYLTEDSYKMFEGMLKNLADDMNGTDNTFIQGFNINYHHDCSFEPTTSSLTYSKRLDTPAAYGDVAIIELSVTINAIDLFYDPAPDASKGAADEIQIGATGVEFTYLSQVPCLRYISVTE